MAKKTTVTTIGQVAGAPTSAEIKHPLMTLPWIMVAAIFVIDLAWSAKVGLTVGHWRAAAVGAVFLLIVSAFYRYRNLTIAAWAEGAALWIAFTSSGCVLTYLAATTGKPLYDVALISADRGMGFDWLEWRQMVVSYSLLYWPLWIAYGSIPLQMLLSIFLLPLVGNSGRVGELVTLGVVTLLLTVLISAHFPVIGPFGTYGEGRDAWFSDFMMLRSGGPWNFNLPAMQGIVAMPSYHTVLAVLFSYAFRRTGWVGWSIFGLNALMLPSIPPIGWHYLSDVIAGGTIAALCVAGVPRLAHVVRGP
jgi:hypothetical protein